jgi:Tol biopolymer transport system component
MITRHTLYLLLVAAAALPGACLAQLPSGEAAVLRVPDAGVGANAERIGREQNGRIAWVEYVPFDATAVFAARADGSGMRQVTYPQSGDFWDNHTEWTADGAAIVFERDFPDISRIFRVRPDGTDLVTLGNCTGACLGDVYPAPGPDGRVAFIRFLGPVLPSGEATSGGVWIMNADGSNEIQVTQNHLPTRSEDRKPTWSPDGRHLAFTRLNNSTAEPHGRQAIFVAGSDGSNPRRVTPWTLDANSPDWSPDGRTILFTSHQDSPIEGPEQLYTVRPDGSDLRIVRPAGLEEPNNWNGRFSPDGRMIIFVHSTGEGDLTDWWLYEMNVDGSDVTLIHHDGQYVDNPTWGTHR